VELKQGKPYLVGYVGVIGKQEGLDYLLDAAYYLQREKGISDTRFVVIGDGTYLPELRRWCQTLGLEDAVHFTGRISDDELLDWLNTADICVNPDEANAMNDKSTMNKIMEYMALGKPIVQFDLTEGRFSAGEASLYARPNDAVDFALKIRYLLENPALRKSMGQFGRERVEHELNWEISGIQLVRAYEGIFARAYKDAPAQTTPVAVAR
jgi:glycosyltransferase involved in cell wall biosynthesis